MMKSEMNLKSIMYPLNEYERVVMIIDGNLLYMVDIIMIIYEKMRSDV